MEIIIHERPLSGQRLANIVRNRIYDGSAIVSKESELFRAEFELEDQLFPEEFSHCPEDVEELSGMDNIYREAFIIKKEGNTQRCHV